MDPRIESLLHFKKWNQEQLEDFIRRKAEAGQQSALLLDSMIQDRQDDLKLIEKQIRDWRIEYVGAFIMKQNSLERQGLPFNAFQVPYPYGPRLPSGPLMYKDGENWIFRRDEKGDYSSHAFWVKHLGVLLEGKEPLDVDDPEWRVVEGAEELLALETEFLKTQNPSLIGRIVEARQKIERLR